MRIMRTRGDRSAARAALPGLALAIVFSWLCIAKVGADEAFSHADWHQVLQQVVDADGLVDYAALVDDRATLDGYLARVRSVSPETDPASFASREHELAYYLNAYNAWVFDGVLGLGAGAESVWGSSQSGYGFFVRQKITVGGNKTNLRKLENQIVRARYRDPRIHAALNCASIGCPRLPQEAFEGDRLESQLDDAMREFVAEGPHCAYDADANEVVLSKIFDWFRKDFEEYETEQLSDGAASGGLIAYINRFRAEDAQIPLVAKVRFAKYDKRLNRQ